MVVLLDLLLLLLLAWQFVNGWRRGLTGTLLSILGLLAGAALGIAILPLLPMDSGFLGQHPLVRVAFAVVLLSVLVSLGHQLGAAAAIRLRTDSSGRLHRSLVGSALGAVLSLSVTALLVWAVGVAVRGIPVTPITSAIGHSSVLRTIDRVMPSGASRAFLPLQQALDRQGFPRVFDGIGVERILQVQAPDPAVAAGPGVRAASASVLKVTAAGARCATSQEGSGWVVRPGLVVTNAHVVAGSDTVRVEDRRGRRWSGRVVEFDPGRDIAVIRVTGLPLTALAQGAALTRGDDAVVAGYPLNGPFDVEPVRVRETLTARGADIYGSPGVTRDIYAVRGTVRPGNSGGPLLTASGRVVGVVFAKSTDDPSTGYVLTMGEVRPVLSDVTDSSRSVPTGACLN